MKRGMLAGGLVLGAVAMASAALLGREQMQGPNMPGMPTVARMVVINSASEAVPVVLAAAGQVQPVTLVETPSVALVDGSVVVSRAGRQGWEYRTIAVDAGQDPAAALTAAGIEGWEAVGVTPVASGASRVLLKRPR